MGLWCQFHTLTQQDSRILRSAIWNPTLPGQFSLHRYQVLHTSLMFLARRPHLLTEHASLLLLTHPINTNVRHIHWVSDRPVNPSLSRQEFLDKQLFSPWIMDMDHSNPATDIRLICVLQTSFRTYMQVEHSVTCLFARTYTLNPELFAVPLSCIRNTLQGSR